MYYFEVYRAIRLLFLSPSDGDDFLLSMPLFHSVYLSYDESLAPRKTVVFPPSRPILVLLNSSYVYPSLYYHIVKI